MNDFLDTICFLALFFLVGLLVIGVFTLSSDLKEVKSRVERLELKKAIADGQ